MKWLYSMKLNRKILLVHIASLLFLAAVLGKIIWESLDNMMVENLQKRGTEIAEHVSALSADYILVEDFYALHELIGQTLETNEDIRYILVLDSNNQVISHTFPEGVPRGILRLELPEVVTASHISVLRSNEGIVHDIIVPIEDGAVGFVRIGMTEANVKAFIARKVQHLIWATVVVCIIAAVASIYITRFITKPINNLVDVATEITAGKLHRRANIRGDDETGKLALAFNKMTDRLISQAAEKEQLLSEKEDLLAELRQKDHLRNILIQKLITAQEDERKRISRELHDETGQAVTSLMVIMRVLAEDAHDKAQKEALLTSRDVAAGILRGIRELAVDLRPPVLDDLGLVSAVRKFIAMYQERHGLTVTLHIKDEVEKVGGQVGIAIYRIVQEGLNNVVKHSGASKIAVFLTITASAITLTIRDNGKGITNDDLEKARNENRLGLYGMKERAELLGGFFSVQALIEGGTELTVKIPMGPTEDGTINDGKG